MSIFTEQKLHQIYETVLSGTLESKSTICQIRHLHSWWQTFLTTEKKIRVLQFKYVGKCLISSNSNTLFPFNLYLLTTSLFSVSNMDNPDSEVVLYLMLRAVDRFYKQHGRYPGMFISVVIIRGMKIQQLLQYQLRTPYITSVVFLFPY